MVERLNGIQEVRGSTPLVSTTHEKTNLKFVFLLLALAVLLEAYWISFVGVAVVIITLIYAIVSSITIEKNNKQ